MSQPIFRLSPLCLLLLPLPAWAADHTAAAQTLETITVKATRLPSLLPFTQGRKASDVRINGEKFKGRSATLGNALAGELGIHSNPFGGGASAPVIRGQEGVRVKILSNSTDVVDMSSLSPDHAVAADTLLAQQVEVLRGTPTLLYAAASPAGVVNIADGRIPERLPERGLTGEAAVRMDTAAKEKAVSAGLILAAGEHLALRAEGLWRRSDNYRVPGIQLGGETLRYVPDTHNRSQVGTLGLSWVGSRGYLGAAYSHRRDRYGLPGHNHLFDECSGHVFSTTEASVLPRNYLKPYPHLMDDTDMIAGIHYHCGSAYDTAKEHSHDNVYGHNHDHSGGGPWIDMVSKRTDIRGEWRQPLPALDKVKLSLTHADYYHDEKHDGKTHIDPDESPGIRERKQRWAAERKGKPEALFFNRGVNARLEAHHRPVGGLRGVFGVQYQTQKSRAWRLYERNIEDRSPLVENTNRQWSAFALEQWRWHKLILEGGLRWEKQHIPIHYDQALLDTYVTAGTQQPDLSSYRKQALSYSGSLLWDLADGYRLSLTASHNERHPSPMELYYYGKHFATNSFEHGNKNLNKEVSNNYEIGLRYAGERWNYKISAYYNRFKNYIHNENLWRSGNLFARRYTQSPARFYGLEGEIGYQFGPKHSLTLFGDVVRGRLFGLPPIYGDKIYEEYEYIDEEGLEQIGGRLIGRETIARPDRNAPRVPPARLGLRLHSHFGSRWSTSLEYTRVFAQNRIARSLYPRRVREEYENDDGETVTQERLEPVWVNEDRSRGYHLLNAGIAYRKRMGRAEYRFFADANNLLNQKIYIHNSHLPYVPQMGRNLVLGVNVTF